MQGYRPGEGMTGGRLWFWTSEAEKRHRFPPSQGAPPRPNRPGAGCAQHGGVGGGVVTVASATIEVRAQPEAS